MRHMAGRITESLRTETVGGLLLVGAAILALIWANSPWQDTYHQIRETSFGPAALHLDLSVAHWTADGLLAIFFFLVGMELKHEFVAGDLRSPKKALVPVAAAAGGVIVPALVYLAFNAGKDTVGGWAIPAATDIAFALAVLAIISSHLPSALRVFLLTLAVVDDLMAILIIAVVYTSEIRILPLLLALIPIGLYWVLVHRCSKWFAARTWSLWLILLPIGIVTWALVHASGVHATLAGVALGMCIPVIAHSANTDGGEEHETSLEHALEHTLRPVSAGLVVPLFALGAAGVTVEGSEFLGSLSSPVVLGIALGLLLGKPVGIMLTTVIVSRLTPDESDDSMHWLDLVGIGMLGGIGFTVSLLVSELSFAGTDHLDNAKIGVLTGTLLSALCATVVLAQRNRHYKRMEASR